MSKFEQARAQSKLTKKDLIEPIYGRGLDALTVLNLRNGATVSEVAQEIRLPRTTTYRILETLSHAGFVYRDANDDRYRLTIMATSMASRSRRGKPASR